MIELDGKEDQYLEWMYPKITAIDRTHIILNMYTPPVGLCEFHSQEYIFED